jgi:uncharacterized membrane protein
MEKKMINIIFLLIGIFAVFVIGCETTTHVHHHHYEISGGSGSLPIGHPARQALP